jgi:hypothetical protein
LAYYIRVLLTEWEDRPLGELVAHSREYGHELRPDAPLDDPGWREADVYGPESTSPIELEVALDDGTPDCLLRAELDEFREELEDSEADPEAVAKVRAHLDRTQGIVAVRVLASDSERGLEAAWAVLDYYAQREGVLFQADGEGFYEGEELVVAIS